MSYLKTVQLYKTISKDHTKQLLQNESRGSIDIKRKPWNYPDSSVNIPLTPNRTCSSPVDHSERLNQQKEDVSATHSVEVQTDKSTLSLLKQDKKPVIASKKLSVHSDFSTEVTGKKNVSHESDLKPYQVNEFECIRLKKTGFNYEYDKLEAKFTANMNTPELLDESDVDQPMDFALCYSETDVEEHQKTSSCLPKSDVVGHGDKVETGKLKAPFSKETTRNKKEMFTNPSKSFKEIFNFFKDRDKKKSNENAKSSVNEPSKKIQKMSVLQEQRPEKSHQGAEHCEKDVISRAEASCSQETPLMFSRCSSLSSLSGIEHISVNDDRSSILSDFSRRTSGVVSPSELPDSPAQSVAANMRPQQKSHFGWFGKKQTLSPQQPKVVPGYLADTSSEINLRRPCLTKHSVFEDNLTAFKDESTPTKLHSMAASSLSSLTIDDDDEEDLMRKIILNREKDSNDEKPDVVINRQEPSGESNNLTDSSSKSEPNNTPYPEQKENLSEEEEDDELTDLTPYEEQLLDQCIRRGIAKWTKQDFNDINPFSWDLELSCRATKAILASKIRNNSYVDFENSIDKSDNVFINQEFLYDNLIFNRHFEDSTKEDEDENVDENVDSNVNEPSDQEENKLTRNSQNITYEEQLLDQCIRKGKAKITKKDVNDIRPFSWDINQICLTTRAVGFPVCSENICGGH